MLMKISKSLYIKPLCLLVIFMSLLSCNKSASPDVGSDFGVGSTPTTGGYSSGASGSLLLISNGNNQILEQNSTAARSLEVLAMNSQGSAIAGVTVAFEVLTSGAGTLTGGVTTAAVVTGINGRASVTFSASAQLGSSSIVASSTAGSAIFTLSVGIAGAGSTLSISSGNGQVVAPSTLAPIALEVIATNSSGSAVSGVTVTFAVTTLNGGVLSNATSSVSAITDASGKASTTFTSSNTTGTISVLASSSVGSATFSLNTSSGGGGGGGSTIVFSPAAFSPASTTWINTEVGTSPTKTVTVTNSAVGNLFINSIFTTSSTPFQITSDTCPRSPTALVSAATCTITIAFSPTAGAAVSKFVFLNWSALNDGSSGTNAVLALEGSGPDVLTFAGIDSVTAVTTTSMTLNWLAATGAAISSYRVYNMNAAPALIATLGSGVLTYNATSLSSNAPHSFRVYAVNSASVEDGNNNTVTTSTLPVIGPVLSAVGNYIYPTTALRAGTDTLSLDVNNSVTGTDTGTGGAITYTCKFSRIINGVSTGKSTCTQSALGGTYSFAGATGIYSWSPKIGTQGTFEFMITGTDTSGPGYEFYTVNVGHPYAAANLSTLLADYRAAFANMIEPNSGAANFWDDVSGLGNTGSITGTPVWAGSTSNTNTDPLRYSFNGTNQIDFGSVLAGQDRFMIDYWISNPENTFVNNSVVLQMDTTSTDNGFKVTQNTLDNNQRALRFDFERSYGNVILTDSPVAYWRMDETSGSTIEDSIGSNDIIFGETTYGTTTTTGLSWSQTGATLGEKTSTAVAVHSNRLNLPNTSTLKPAGDFTVEYWIKYNTTTTPGDHELYSYCTAGANVTAGIWMGMLSGVLTVEYKPTSAAAVILTVNSAGYGRLFDKNWHHIVFTSSAANKVLYLDGTVLASSTANDGAITWPVTPTYYWAARNGDAGNPTSLDEVAVYNYALSTNQIKNHLAAGDHFVRNQALHPANAQMQGRPLGFWRFGETDTNYIAFDSSGNQQDMFNISGFFYRSAGVYSRAGGSGLDSDGATASEVACASVNRENKIHNNRLLTFDQKMSFSTWVNFNAASANYHIFFSTNKNATNEYGFMFSTDGSGKLKVVINGTWASSPISVLSTSAITPSTASPTVPLGWYHLAFTYDGTLGAANRIQFYVNGTPIKMATPTGTIPTSISPYTGTAWDFEVGMGSSSNGCYGACTVPMDEVAFYNRVLAGNEIRAQAQEASLRYCDVPVTSLLQDPYNAKPFDYLNMLFDGTKLSVFRNSKLECAIRPSINLGSEALDLTFGSTSNGFQGHLTDLRVHGASGSTVATITDAYNAFINSSEQHRVVPLGKIVTDNLVRAYEPSTAFDGVRPYSAGSEDTKLQWADIGHLSSGVRQEPAMLKNFTSAGSTGWNGTGIPTDPYRLTFDGVNDWVDLGTTPIMQAVPNKMSVCLWMKTVQTAPTVLFYRGAILAGDFTLSIVPSTPDTYLHLNYSNGGTAIIGGAANLAILRNGSWHYFCGTYNGANSYLYIDGTLIGSAANTVNINNSATHMSRMTLGGDFEKFYQSTGWPGGFFNGDMGGVHIYNDGLTQAQVRQNCNAQQANYNVTTCAP